MNNRKIQKWTAMASAAFMIALFVPGVQAKAAQPLSAATWDHSAQIATYEGQMITVDSIGMVPENVADIFDADLYASLNPDVVEACGEDSEALYNHFMTCGLFEGRIGSRVLDIALYRRENPDLEELFGDNWDLYVQHYFACGILEGRWNGYRAKKETEKTFAIDGNGSITAADGITIVPWEQVEDRTVTLEQLIAQLGENMVLLMDENTGKVKYIAGNLSDETVTNAEEAQKFLAPLLDALGVETDLAMLQFNRVIPTADGVIFYKFNQISDDTNQTRTYSNSNLVVGVSADGKVFSITHETSTSYEAEADATSYGMALSNLEAAGYQLLTVQNGIYASETDGYQNVSWYYRAGENGTPDIYAKLVGGMQDSLSLTFYDHLAEEGDGSTNYSYLFDHVNKETNTIATDAFGNQNVEITTVTLKGQFGEDVILPVAKVGEDKYYFYDPDRKLIALNDVSNGKYFEAMMGAKLGILDGIEPYYFSVQDSENTLPAFWASALRNVSAVRDLQDKELSLYDQYDHATFINLVSSNMDNAIGNVFNQTGMVTLYETSLSATLDVVAHEMNHIAVAYLTEKFSEGNSNRTQTQQRAMSEAYADVVGNIMEIILASEDGNGSYGEVDFENWLLGESTDNTVRSMGNPSDYGQPAAIGDAGYVIGTSTYTEYLSEDAGGQHSNSNIFSHIAYRMWKESGLSLEQVYKIWFNTIPSLNTTTTAADVEGLLYATMQQYGGVIAEKAADLATYFEDAGLHDIPELWEDTGVTEGNTLLRVEIEGLDEMKIVVSDFDFETRTFVEIEKAPELVHYLSSLRMVDAKQGSVTYGLSADEEGNIAVIVPTDANISGFKVGEAFAIDQAIRSAAAPIVRTADERQIVISELQDGNVTLDASDLPNAVATWDENRGMSVGALPSESVKKYILVTENGVTLTDWNMEFWQDTDCDWQFVIALSQKGDATDDTYQPTVYLTSGKEYNIRITTTTQGDGSIPEKMIRIHVSDEEETYTFELKPEGSENGVELAVTDSGVSVEGGENLSESDESETGAKLSATNSGTSADNEETIPECGGTSAEESETRLEDPESKDNTEEIVNSEEDTESKDSIEETVNSEEDTELKDSIEETVNSEEDL